MSKLRVWDALTGQCLLTRSQARDRFGAVAFRPDGRRIAIVHGFNSEVETLDPSNGHADRTLEGHAGSVGNIAYSADGTFLAAGGDENTVELWNADDGTHLGSFTGHTEPVVGVAFSPDGRLIASTGWDKTVAVWERATGKRLVAFKAHPESVNGLAFHPNGSQLATVSEDKSVRIWDIQKIVRDSEGTVDIGHGE